MKILKLGISFCILMVIGMFITYADNKSNNEYSRLLNTLEVIGADYKFYNVKANAKIEENTSKSQINDICIDIVNNLGLEESNIKWEKSTKNQIYAEIKCQDMSISIIGIIKNDEESYIMVDILQNKVYKSIVDIYTILENTLEKYANQVDINSCLAGEYTKKLQMSEYNEITQKILYNMNAREIDRVHDENFISITAYSEILSDNYLEYMGNKINLNIGMRYSEDDEKTFIYIATPIIKLDY